MRSDYLKVFLLNPPAFNASPLSPAILSSARGASLETPLGVSHDETWADKGNSPLSALPLLLVSFRRAIARFLLGKRCGLMTEKGEREITSNAMMKEGERNMARKL
jgi:hypothetical protein